MTRVEGTAHIPNWLIRDERVGVYEIAVYAALASRSGKGGIWPSQATIAGDARCSERQVREALKKLRELGVVSWQKVTSSKGVLNVYLLHPEGTILDFIPDEDDADEGAAQGAGWGGGVRHTVPEVGGGPAPHAGGVRHTVPGKKNPIKKLKSPYVSSEAAGLDAIQAAEVAPERPDVEAILDYLDERIVANGAKKPERIKRNRDAVRLMLDLDKRSPEDVRNAIDYATGNEFWRANILSASKLREKFDQLRLSAMRDHWKAPTSRHERDAQFWENELAKAREFDQQAQREQLLLESA